jgi:lipopolysaccharide/colanic/teichoic acid biosynthesis glycosyltransferase|tara:strand:- start:23 stop:646 length:624 start_codon:yes stop_codon:yes gene_type:complete
VSNYHIFINSLKYKQLIVKRTFDIFFSTLGLIVFIIPLTFAFICASLDTGMNGFYKQERIGRYGKKFNIFKIRTMKNIKGVETTITTLNDERITKLGRVFRKFKIDELPQLINVLIGSMSFVGPRPDVEGFADRLLGDDRLILTVRPGITGPASIKYKNEEKLLSISDDIEIFNQKIFNDKVMINKKYIKEWTLVKDIKYIIISIFH